MGDRGIIFSAPMVRALLDGRKTQTRRILKVPGIMGGRFPIYPPEDAIELEDGEFAAGVFHYRSTGALSGPYRLPAAVGDRLWVRETFRHWQGSESRKTACYVADGTWLDHGSGWTGKPEGIVWCSRATPSIHMPRWASRLTLIVEAVKVEPLQAISAHDCYEEGIQRPSGPHLGSAKCAYDNARTAYRDLWQSLHGAGSWEANPAVVALTFRVERRNIDAEPGKAAA